MLGLALVRLPRAPVLSAVEGDPQARSARSLVVQADLAIALRSERSVVEEVLLVLRNRIAIVAGAEAGLELRAHRLSGCGCRARPHRDLVRAAGGVHPHFQRAIIVEARID